MQRRISIFSDRLVYPKGIMALSPGLRRKELPWVTQLTHLFNRNAVAAGWIALGAAGRNAVGVGIIFRTQPKVGARANLGLEAVIPLGYSVAQMRISIIECARDLSLRRVNPIRYPQRRRRDIFVVSRRQRSFSSVGEPDSQDCCWCQ